MKSPKQAPHVKVCLFTRPCKTLALENTLHKGFVCTFVLQIIIYIFRANKMVTGDSKKHQEYLSRLGQ